MKKYIFILIILVLNISCDDRVSANYNLEDEISVKYQRMVYVDNKNLRISFEEFSESRCPKDGVCVWEGEAIVKLKVDVKHSGSETVELKIPGYVMKENTDSHQSVIISNYKITLMQLDPYPSSRVRINPESYTALLKIKKERG